MNRLMNKLDRLHKIIKLIIVINKKHIKHKRKQSNQQITYNYFINLPIKQTTTKRRKNIKDFPERCTINIFYSS